MSDPSFIHVISSRLDNLPGREAQDRMAHVGRQHDPRKAPEDSRKAAVLILLYPKNNHWHTVFIQRKKVNKKDRHRGQIGLPGGKMEDSDRSIAETALRECEEEIGMEASEVQLLGQLTDLYIPVSNFHVFPYVGFTRQTPAFRRQEEEVDAIIEVAIPDLRHPEKRGITSMRLDNHAVLKNIPYYDVHGHVLWGATAMIISEFLALLESPATVNLK